MNKLYDRIDFVNNTTPALNETNLDLMSKAIDDIDDRVIEIAGDVLVVVPEILDKYADIEALATNPPYVGQNGHWWTWDTDLNQYVDSGVDAGVSVTVGTTTTLPAGSSATVTNSGTDTDPILNFGIPQGVAGQNGQDGADGQDGQDGVSPTVTIGEITGGHSVTITDAEHPSGQTFNVLNGVDGQDGQDGADGVGVPTGGTTGQVLAKASGTDYDTEWVNASGGSGGHTIINDAGTSMTQRVGLQFEGMGITDDSTNDRTKVKLPIFNGTTERWEELSSAEKAKYTIVNFSNDYGIEPVLLYTMTNQMNGSSVVVQDLQNLNIDTTPYKKLLLELVILNSNDQVSVYAGNIEVDLSHIGVPLNAEATQISVYTGGSTDTVGFVAFQLPAYPRRITRVHLNSKWSTLTNKMQMKVYGIN